jgi:hypothetical protein
MASEPKEILTWYHWAPLDRRKRIKKVGLLPGSWSTDRMWKPPYICLAQTAEIAWSLSGAMPRGQLVKNWDLWEVWVGDQPGFEIIYEDSFDHIKEIRVYERIYKRNIWYVGSRRNA